MANLVAVWRISKGGYLMRNTEMKRNPGFMKAWRLAAVLVIQGALIGLSGPAAFDCQIPGGLLTHFEAMG